MKCTCGGWMFCAVAELDGRQRVVIKCDSCGKSQLIGRNQPMQTKRMAQDHSAFKALPKEKHEEYLRRRAIEEGFTLSAWA